MNQSVAIPPLDMFLYNTTGKQTTGYHYDPVFPIDRRKRPRLKPDVKEQLHCITALSQQTVLPKSSILDVKSKRLEGLQKKIPTYLNAVDPFRKRCDSAVCTGGCDKKIKPEDLHDKNGGNSAADDFVAQAIPVEEEYNGLYTVRGHEF